MSAPARRPEGWVAPGPPPRGAQGRAELEPGPDEDLSYLCGDWRLFQKQRGHRWSLDDLITAWVAVRHADVSHAIDLGCGLGSVLLMLAWSRPALRVTGIEAQADRAAMARRSIAFNGADERCRVLDGDLRDPSLPLERAPLVTGTPPYFPPGEGTESEKPHAAPCRFEHRGGVETYLEAAGRWLAPGGTFVMCAPVLALDRIDPAAKAAGLTRVARLEVTPRDGKPKLIVVDTFRHSSTASSDCVTSGITVRSQDSQWTAEFRAVRERLGLPNR